MNPPADAAPLLDETHAAFVQGGVAIAVASRDPRNLATVARACGCRVSPDRRTVTVFLDIAQAEPLLSAVHASNAIAAVFCEPSTDRTIQLKGVDATVAPLGADDAAALPSYVTAMIGQMALAGFSEAYARTAWEIAPERLVAVRFTPAAAFVQTPGPRAGKPLQV